MSNPSLSACPPTFNVFRYIVVLSKLRNAYNVIFLDSLSFEDIYRFDFNSISHQHFVTSMYSTLPNRPTDQKVFRYFSEYSTYLHIFCKYER